MPDTKKTIICPIDDSSDLKVVLSPVREFPTERIIFLCMPDGLNRAQLISKEIMKLGIPSSTSPVKSTGNPWEDFFVSLADLLEGASRERFVINVSTADRISQCALTNAAHVNGVRAVAVLSDKILMLPILQLSFGSLIAPTKMRILRTLQRSNCMDSLEALSKQTGLSLQLVSYHIKGTQRSKGLTSLELVDIHEERGRIRVCLSTMGRLLMNGYVEQKAKDRATGV